MSRCRETEASNEMVMYISLPKRHFNNESLKYFQGHVSYTELSNSTSQLMTASVV
jgi:hypothetical protein